MSSPSGRPKSINLGDSYNTTPQNVTASFQELQLRAQLMGQKEAHYLAVSCCGTQGCNGIYVRMPQQEHNGVGIYYSGAGYTISREIVDGSPGFVLGRSPDALYGAETEEYSPCEESVEWAPYEGKLPVPSIRTLNQNLLRTWGYLEVKSGFRWFTRWCVIEGLALVIYKDRDALEQSQRSLQSGGPATKRRDVVVLKSCELKLPETKSKKRANKFFIHNSEGKVLKMFSADTLQDTMLWISAIKTTIKLCSETEKIVGEICETPPPPPADWETSFSNPLRNMPRGLAPKSAQRGLSSRNIAQSSRTITRKPKNQRLPPMVVRRSHSEGSMERQLSGDSQEAHASDAAPPTRNPAPPKSKPPPLPPNLAPPPVPPSTRDQIRELYEQHNPDMLKAMDGLLEKFKGKEEALLKSLKKKYGSSNGSADSAASSSNGSPAAASGSAADSLWGGTGFVANGGSVEDRNAEFFAKMKKQKADEALQKEKRERERIDMMTPEERAEYEEEQKKEAARQKLQGRMLDVQMRQYGIKKWKKPSSRNLDSGTSKARKLGGRGRGRGRGRRGRGRGRGRK